MKIEKKQNGKRQVISYIVAILLLATILSIPNVASVSASFYDMTTDPGAVHEATINGAIWKTLPIADPTGSGVFNAFFRVQASPTERGYNTHGRPLQFDEKSSLTFTHAAYFADVPLVEYPESSGNYYYEFQLDINQLKSSPYISLDKFQVWTTNDKFLLGYDETATYPDDGLPGTFPKGDGTGQALKVYDLDGDGDTYIKMDYRWNTGSGKRDYKVLVPEANFVGKDLTYVVIFTRHGDNYASNDGFEEWGVAIYDVIPATKSGYKWHDINADGFWDTGEPGLDHWEIEAYAGTSATGDPVTSVYTDENGYYEFLLLNPGTYTFAEVMQPDWHQSFPAAPGTYTETLASGQVSTDNNFGNYIYGCLEVTKVVDWNGAIPDTSKTFEICIEGPSYPSGDCHVFGSSGGTYTWENLLPGTYYVNESYPGCLWTCDNPTQQVTVDPGTSCATTTFTNTLNLLCISGYKTRNFDGAAVSGVTINLKDEAGSVIATTSTNLNGFYEFCGLLPGVYSVEEVLPDGWVQISAPGPITLVCDDSTGNNFVNKELLCISGYKLDDCGGAGLSGWTITLKDDEGAVLATTTTDGSGFYSFCGLEAGTYYVEETLDCGWYQISAPGAIVLTCENSTGNNFVNHPLLCISGYKIDDCIQEGLSDWTITLKDATGAVVGTTTTGADGYYFFCGLEAGMYTLEETLESGWYQISAPVPITLVCDDAVYQNFTNHEYMCISGYKYDACGGIPSVDFFFDFEANDGGWINSASWEPYIGDWEWTNTYNVANYVPGAYAASEIPPPNAYSGTGLWGTILYAPYTNAGGYSYLTKTFDFTGMTDVTISWRSWEQVFGSFDFCQLRVNGNLVWGPSWNYSAPVWHERTVDLSAYDGNPSVTIQFEMYATTVVNYSGWYIDDITISSSANGDAGLSGWTITLKDDEGAVLATTTTDGSGFYSFCGLEAGTYYVEETMESGWYAVSAPGPITLICEDSTGNNFYNQQFLCISGYKLRDGDNAAVSGVTINLKDEAGSVIATTSTNLNGFYEFCGLMPGSYTVEEVLPAGWLPISAPGPITLVCDDAVNQNFVNQQLGCLNITKSVNWNGIEPIEGQTFEICITGPSYPSGDCKTFTYPNDLSMEWCDLIPGSYTITETDPGNMWTVQITGSPAVVPIDGGTAYACVTNCRKLGCLEVTKVVDWNGAGPIEGQTFEICITGPSYPSGDCKTFTYPNHLVKTWCGLIPGAYTVSEPGIGVEWDVVIDDSGAIVPVDGGTAFATVNNTHIPPGCTLTQGFWKTHSEYGPAPYNDTWAELTNGADTLFFDTGISYYSILWLAPKGGNAYLILAHQYIAAELNSLIDGNPALPPDIQLAMTDAEVLLDYYDDTMVIPKGSCDRVEAIRLAGILGNFNEGYYPGWNHCD